MDMLTTGDLGSVFNFTNLIAAIIVTFTVLNVWALHTHEAARGTTRVHMD